MSKIVAVSTITRSVAINHSSLQQISCVNTAVLDCLNEFGLTPILVPNIDNEEGIRNIISAVDGLVLTSGQDIDPEMYKEKQKVQYSKDVSGVGTHYSRPMIMSPDKTRDSVERQLYMHAKSKKLPILGICRGMQLINICEGGELHQEMDCHWMHNHNIENDGWIHYHDIVISGGTQLAKIVDSNRMSISTIHHQCIRSLGASLQASAVSDDGVIEAIEHIDHDFFILGLQGHIERPSPHNAPMKAIWRAFADRVKEVPYD